MTTNYLDIDINKLFEQHTIKEIEEIQKKIQLESDRKKIELRTLVGERYRDLILAADTIGKMKITAERVTSRIAKIEDKFRELQKKYLIGFKIEPVKNEIDRTSNKNFCCIVIQIKILMDIPEHIWTRIENKDLLYATQLFIIAQHIKYSLSFEVGNEILREKYPIVIKQWDIINEFKVIILRECDNILESLDVSTESIANCLASLVLLKRSLYTELLKKLISTRSRAIESIIKDESDRSVKIRIKLCIEILIHTVTLIYTCFITFDDKKEGLVSQYITAIKNQEANSFLSQLDVNQDMMEKFLSSVTKNHKPFVQDTPDNFSMEDLQTSVRSWLEWVNKFCNQEINKLFELIVSVKGLYSIRQEIVSIHLPENWNHIWEDLSLPKMNFLLEFFQPLITKRVKNIIDDKWMQSITRLKSDTMELLNKIIQDKFEFPEHDLRWFVWKDSANDIPQKLTTHNGLDSKRSLLMKTKGYSPHVVKLCEHFDSSLHDLLTDLEQYLNETEHMTSLKNNLLSTNFLLKMDTYSDSAEIHEHLQKVSIKMIEDFIIFVKGTCIPNKSECGKSEINAIVMARFLSALTTLCPNLAKCFTLSKVSGLTVTNTKWQTICDNLKEESIAIWSIWANIYKLKICDHRKKYMSNESFSGLRVQLIVSDWEKIMLEEESSEGKTIKSEILVPYQPSVPLQKFLTAVIKDLNKAIPHTLPKKVLHDIIEAIATELFTFYHNMSREGDLHQKQAFHMLFDVKYCTLLMVPRENRSLVELSTKALESMLFRIDPFDYGVFDPFLYVNVKKSVLRSLLVFGNLIPHLEQLHSILGARCEYNTSEGSKSESPAVLAICTGAPWFPPLAVTAPSRNLPLVSTAIPDKIQRKKPVPSKEKSDSAGAAIKSGAAAFFGAMGSDWFGTS